MSNQSILERMRASCDRFQAGEIGTIELKGEISSLAEVLEIIRRPAAEAVKKFEYGIWWGSELCYEDDKNEESRKELHRAVSELRDWIATELAKIGLSPPVPDPDSP
jgi:hypothetical protein